MKKTTLKLFALLLLINPLLSSHAQENDASSQYQTHSELYTLVTEHLKQKTDQKLFEVEIQLRKLSPNLKLPACKESLTLKDRNPDNYTGRMALSVSCLHPKWRVFIPATVKGKRPVVISTKGILKLAVIKEEDIKKVLLPYKKVPKDSLIDPKTVIGMRALKAIPPNKVLKVKDLQAPYWVFKNQQVNIITRIGGIEVSTTGQALKSGVELQQVPVKNLSSEKIMKGIVIAPNTVLIP